MAPQSTRDGEITAAKLGQATTRVLVVDDHEAICSLIKRQLVRHGYEVVTANSIQGGLEALNAAFDVAVLDVDLPDGKGFELVEAIRNNTKSPTSVVMMTGDPSESTLNSSVHQGISEFLFKPFSSLDLRNAITRALEASQRWNERLARLEGRAELPPPSETNHPAPTPQGVNSNELAAGEINRLTQMLVERHHLTDRERETLLLMLRGLQNLEIAHALNISANTVKYHVRNLLTKLGVESRTDLFRSLLDQPE